MGINYVLRIRAGTMKDRPNAASEIEVRWDDADSGPCGTSLAMARQRGFDSAGTPGAPAAFSAHQSRDQHVALTLPSLGQ
jgi:hypothetical protein